jgi:heme-degrading monooxygenase HmoA
MVTIGMNYSVIPGKESAFENAFKAVITALSKAEGHAESRLYRDVDQSGSYLIMSRWEDEAAYQTFISSEAFRNVTNWGKENILSGRPSHQTYK